MSPFITWESLKSVYTANIHPIFASNGDEYLLDGLSDTEMRSLFQCLAEHKIIRALSDEETKTAIEIYTGRSGRKFLLLILQLTNV